MPSSLVFIDDIDDIKFLESVVNKDTVVVSIMPAVSAELKRIGIPFETTLKLFGPEGHRYVLSKSFEIVEEIRPFLNNKSGGNTYQAFEKTWIFHFRFHLHYLLSMLYIINKAVKKYKPNKLINFSEISHKNSKIDSSNKKYLLNEIVKNYATSIGITTQNINNRKILKSKKNNLISIKKLFKQLVFEAQLVFFKLVWKSKSPILALEDTFKMPHFIRKVSQHTDQAFPVYLTIQRNSLKTRLKEMLMGKIYFFIFLPSDTKLNEYTFFQKKIDTYNSKIKKYFLKEPALVSIFGLNINTFLIDFIENTLSKKMHHLNGETVSLKKILKTIKPKKVFSQHSLGIGHTLGEICSESNIPALLISHGSHVPHNQPLAELEWSIHSQTLFNAHYPFVAIQTPWAYKFFKNQKKVISKKIITGPLLFAQQHLNRKSQLQCKKKLFNDHLGKRIILHAGTPKSWNSLRPLVYETLDEYINNINDVIKAIENIPGLFLAIRFRPHKEISIDDLKSSLNKSECYDIFMDGEFEDYLMASDFLLSYSSTTIEEALQYNIPVVQYDSDGKYEHISAEKLGEGLKSNISPIYSVLSRQDLNAAFCWLCENHNYSDNMSINWSKHKFEVANKMDWLSLMDLR
jgi:hypothetical protein